MRAAAVSVLRRWRDSLRRQGDVPFLYNQFSTFSRIKDRGQLRSALAERSKKGFEKRSDCVAFYERMLEIAHLSPTTADFNIFFNIITKSKLYPTAIILIKRMRHAGNIPIDDLTLNVMLNCYCRLDRVHYALSVFSTFFKLGYGPPHEAAFTVLMNGLIRDNRIDDALVLFDKLVAEERGGRDVNCVTQATVLNALFKAGHAHKAIWVLNQIGCNFGRIIYNTVINGLCKCGEVDAARTYYSWTYPTASTFNSLIQGFAKLGRWDDVKILLEELVVEKVLPNAYSYYVLRDVVGYSGAWEAFEMVDYVIVDYKRFHSLRAEPDLFPQGSALAKQYYKEGNPVEDILEVMADAKADLVAYNTVMKVYCLDGRMEEALQILFSEGLCPNISSYNIIIGAYCDRMELDAALHLFREMLPREGLRPDTETFNCLLKGLLIGGRCDDARVIFHEMVVNRGMVPDNLMYTSLLHTLSNGGKAEKKLSSANEHWYKWLNPDFFHEEIFDRAEKILLSKLPGDRDYTVYSFKFELMMSTVLKYFAGRVTRYQMELFIDSLSPSSKRLLKQIVRIVEKDLDSKRYEEMWMIPCTESGSSKSGNARLHCSKACNY